MRLGWLAGLGHAPLDSQALHIGRLVVEQLEHALADLALAVRVRLEGLLGELGEQVGRGHVAKVLVPAQGGRGAEQRLARLRRRKAAEPRGGPGRSGCAAGRVASSRRVQAWCARLLVVFSRIEATVNDVISGARCERHHGVRRCGRGRRGVGVRQGLAMQGLAGTPSGRVLRGFFGFALHSRKVQSTQSRGTRGAPQRPTRGRHLSAHLPLVDRSERPSRSPSTR